MSAFSQKRTLAWSLLGGFLVGRLFGQAEGPQLRHLFRSFLPSYFLFL